MQAAHFLQVCQGQRDTFPVAKATPHTNTPEGPF